MPIGEAHRSGSSFTGLAEYILAQGIYSSQNPAKKPEIVYGNHIYESNYLKLGKEFREVAKENPRVSKPVMHFTVNFKTSDNISNENQIRFVRRIIEEMGVQENNHQFLIVKHNDKHPHFHIQVNRIGFDGKTLSDSNSKLRIGTACDKIEKEMGLDNYLKSTRAFVYDEELKSHVKNTKRDIHRGLPIVKATINRQLGIQEKKDYIQIETLKILQNHKIDSLESLQGQLKIKNINFRFSVNQKDQVAVSFQYNGLAVKGTQVCLKGNMIMNQLLANQKVNNQLEEKLHHLGLIKETYPKLVKSITQIVDVYNSGRIPNLETVLKANGIKFNNETTIEYKDLIIDFVLLKQFILTCQAQVQEARDKFNLKLSEYQELQNTKFKKGFLGVLNPEQRKFNDLLKVKLDNSQLPVLEIGIKSEDFINEIQKRILQLYNDRNAKKVIKHFTYVVDQSINLGDVTLKNNEENNKSLSTSKNSEQAKLVQIEKISSVNKTKSRKIK